MNSKIKEIFKKIPYLRVAYAFWVRNPIMVWSDLVWMTEQSFKKARLSLISKSKLHQLKDELETTNYDRSCLITVTFGSFHIGNRDPLLPRFFESFINFTQTPSAFEFLIKLDEGDDYIFYHKLKKKYDGKLNIRFFVSPRGRGYADMHLWHSSLIQYRSPTAKALYILTEDAEFYFKNWDEELLRLVSNRKNTFFIATPCKLEEAISIMGPNPEKPVPVYWVRGDDFPVFGFDLLKTAEHFTQHYPDWVALGNLFNIDGYSGDLLRIAWKDFQVNLHEEIQLYALRKGVYDWSENPIRGTLRNNTLIEFFQHENVEIRKNLVQQIIENLKLNERENTNC